MLSERDVVRALGMRHYLGQYLQPTPLMLPFNVIGELSRTLALAVRLFGNVMSGGIIGAILLLLAPFLIPVVMQVLGLLVSMIHAYIFAVLALVYIASASQSPELAHQAADSAEPATTSSNNHARAA